MGLARSFFPLLLFLFASPVSAQQDLSGTVVDQGFTAARATLSTDTPAMDTHVGAAFRRPTDHAAR